MDISGSWAASNGHTPWQIVILHEMFQQRMPSWGAWHEHLCHVVPWLHGL